MVAGFESCYGGLNFYPLFECVDCGYTENADLVGAINVLKRGQELLAMQYTVDLLTKTKYD